MGRLRSHLEKGRLEAGCDEAGRGCLAGPVVAAAVILQPGIRLAGLNDSKKIPERLRNELRGIIESKALAWSVCTVSPAEIDRVNILQASFTAMHRAVELLTTNPEHLLIDGHLFRPYPHIPHTCVIKGDGKFRAIAAASILAKCHRDELMRELHKRYPAYDWAKNKGYPTAAHRAAISQHGVCKHHRKTFAMGAEQLELSL